MKNIVLSIYFLFSFLAIASSQGDFAYEVTEGVSMMTLAYADTPNTSNYSPKLQNINAHFKGGQKALATYLSEEIQYPESAKLNAQEGIINVKFQVAKDGSINSISLMNSISHQIDAEVVRVIQTMPKWEPTLRNGRAIKSVVVVPVAFRLQ